MLFGSFTIVGQESSFKLPNITNTQNVVSNFKMTLEMILCLTLKDIITIVLQIFGVIVSTGTLILAWKIMKRFHKQHISVKQLDKVTELIDFINNHRIKFLFGTSSGNLYGGTLIDVSLFELKSVQFDDTEFLSSNVLLNRGTRKIIDFSNFINNPLIPNEISEELKNFYSWQGQAIYVSEISGNLDSSEETTAVIIETGDGGDCYVFNKTGSKEPDYISYEAFACQDWNNFKECSKSLENSIRHWLSKYNINEIKIIE